MNVITQAYRRGPQGMALLCLSYPRADPKVKGLTANINPLPVCFLSICLFSFYLIYFHFVIDFM